MTPDVSTGDIMNMLCLNCARRVVSPKHRSKYEGLTSHLKFRGAFTGLIKLSFARIDGLIGSNLPMDAYRDEKWWGNSGSTVHSRAWVDAGWEAQEVNLKDGVVWFKKSLDVSSTRNRHKTGESITAPFTPVPVRPLKRKTPSKTKVSKLYARILNLERQRKSGYGSSRGFKGKSMYEKRLFGSDQKPQ